jgi:hypothetical protein
MIETAAIVFTLALAFGLAAGALLLRARRAVLQRLHAAEQGRAQMELQLTAFRGAIEALAQALARAEERHALLAERIDAVESAGEGGQPYGDAIRLVRQGAAETRLVDELGLSPVEAQLIVRLHGARAH